MTFSLNTITMVRFLVFTLCVALTWCTGHAIPEEDALVGTVSRSLRTLQSLGQVDRLVLINADTDMPIMDLINGTVINVATMSTTNFNIQATLVANSGSVGSIKFGYNTRPNFRTEASAPYAFCGDWSPSGNYHTCTNLVTSALPHVVSATPYSGSTASGTKGLTKTVSFLIIDQPPTVAPTKMPSVAPTFASMTTAPTNQPSLQPIVAPACTIPQVRAGCSY